MVPQFNKQLKMRKSLEHVNKYLDQRNRLRANFKIDRISLYSIQVSKIAEKRTVNQNYSKMLLINGSFHLKIILVRGKAVVNYDNPKWVHILTINFFNHFNKIWCFVL